MGYVNEPLDSDPVAIAAEAYDYIQARIPGWVPAEGNLEVILVEAWAQAIAELRDIETDVRDQIFRYLGANLHQIAPVDASSATGQSTWTMIDNLGYTIEAGTQVAIPATGSESVGFEVETEVVVPPGSTATTGVTLVAIDPGAAGSGLSGTPQLVDALEFVAAISLVGITTGGVDAEEDSVYLDRLVAELQLQSPRPILPADFAQLARRIGGVDRAVALDGYNPATGTFNNERMVTVVGVTSTGAALSSTQKAQIDASLQAMREVNFVVNVADPTYTTVGVTFSAVAVSGFDPVSVRTAGVAALDGYLSPANWGTAQFGDSRLWFNTRVVRYLEVAAVLNGVEGLDYITALTINGSAADLALSGAVPLPTVGTISGSVAAP